MQRLEKLFVLWSDPGRVREGQRHVIGELWRDADGYAFAYASDLAAPQRAGFSPIIEFPELRGVASPYRARHLFWTFAERIPSPRRPDFADLMRSWGVAKLDDQFEVLALSGGVQATDRLELAEYRSADDDLSVPLLFRLAGERHSQAAAELKIGDPVSLRCDPTNSYDPHATQVIYRGDQRIGYVPAQYSKLFACQLGKGVGVKAEVVRRLMLPEERGRWVLSAQANELPR